MKLSVYVFCITIIFFSCDKENNFFKESPLPAKVDSLFKIVYVDTLSIESKEIALREIGAYLKTRKNDSTKRNSYFKVASRYYYLNKFDNHYKYAKRAYSLGIKANDTATIAKAYYYLGDYFFEYKNIDSAFFYYNKARLFYSVTNDNDTQCNVLLKISALYKRIKDYSNSEKYAVEAIKIAEKEKNHLIRYGSYNQLGNLLTTIKNYDRSEFYHKKALEEALNSKEIEHYKPVLVSQSYINLGVLKLEEKEYLESKEYFEEALKIKELSRLYPLNYAYLLKNYAYVKHVLGDKIVMPLFNKAFQINDSMGYDYAKTANSLMIAKYYLESGRPDSSFFYAKQAYKTTIKEKILDNRLEALHLLAKTSVEKSPSWYEAYIKLQDSIVDYERRQRDKFALIAYDTESMRMQKTVAETQRDKAKTQLWGIAALSLLFGFGVFMILKYRLKRLKHRELLINQKELQANETIYKLMIEEQFKIEQGKHLEKKRISQELHDGVLGKLSGVRLNLFALNKKQDKETIEKCLFYIKDLQKIEKEIRAISHNLSKDLFSDQVNFTKMVSGLFEKITDHTTINLHLYFDELIDWKSIPTKTKIEVYRILQEGLQNIEKHARANHVIVRMFQDKNEICIELTDDGIGMHKSIHSKGIGLKNIKERATKINANFQLETQKNKGTTLRLFIPKESL